MITIQQAIEYFLSKQLTVLQSDQVNTSQQLGGSNSLDYAEADNLSFLSNEVDIEKISASKSLIIILNDNEVTDRSLLPSGKVYILASDARKEVILFLKAHFSPQKTITKTSIHPTAVIEKNLSIGERSLIEANVVIEENVTIGKNCVIGAGTIIKSNTIIGDGVVIGNLNVIGGDGYGYVKNDQNGYDHFPHLGKVIIHDDVWVGSNCCIDKGSLKDTILRKGSMIESLTYIGHNSEVGEHTFIGAGSITCGSSVVGHYCWVAAGTTIRNAITIGNHVTIGLASTVTKSIASNQTVSGSPALPIEEYERLQRHQQEIINQD